MKNSETKQFNFYPLLIVIISFGVFLYFFNLSEKKVDYSQIVKDFEIKIHQKEVHSEKIIVDIINELKKTKQLQFKKLAEKYNSSFNKKNGLSVFLYKNDSLIFWSDNSVPLTEKFYESYQDGDFLRLNNGNYIIKKQFEKPFLVIVTILIKNEYKYNNDYLLNNYREEFEISPEFTISDNVTLNNIHNKNGKFLFSFKPSPLKELNIKNKNTNISGLLCLLIVFLFLIVLLNLNSYLQSRFPKNSTTLIMILIIIISRLLMFYFKVPEVIYKMILFGPAIYASSEFLPSFGDLILNTVFFTFIAILIFRNFELDNTKIKIKKVWRIIIATVLSFLPLVFSDISAYLLKSLIINSNVSFNINNLFELTFYSIIGFIITGLLLFSFFLLIEKISRIVIHKLINLKEFMLIAISILLLYSGFKQFNFHCLLYLLPFFAIYIISAYNLFKFKRTINVSTITLYLIFFTFFTNVLLYENNSYKEKEKRKSVAIRLTKKGDPTAEFLFGEVNNKIKEDNRLISLLKIYPLGESDINKLIQSYFTGYWNKYDLQITVCQKNDKLIIKPDNVEVDCYAYFNDKIKTNLVYTTNFDNLFNINSLSGRNSYIAVFSYKPLKFDTLIPNIRIFLEFDSKYIHKELGYPELLIDSKVNINRDYGNYSYVKYFNNEQILQYGQYFYSLNLNNYKDLITSDFNFFSKDGFDHLIYKTENTTVIISRKSDGFFNIISPFSYLFAFNFMLVLLIVFLMSIPINTNRIKVNFKNRVQISMIGVVLVSFVFIGGVAVYYIIKIYNNKNLDNITEKSHSILIELERKFSGIKNFTPDMYDNLTEQLVKYSNIFFTDVNLYDVKGELLASSRQKIFDEGLVSEKMNTEAYLQLISNEKNFFVHNENIGKLNYISAYIPFRNYNNQIIAYLNLPYFAKQSELKKEISAFLVKFINIYVLLIALAILIALIISNRITKPLRLIRENISRIMLGRINEKISWSKKDEIGNLIKEYNRMIDELEKSAELLAKSERESAWREMAKQVAHEIKNPLTPMKLSVQHLQKAWHDKSPNWEERLEKFSKTIIEQIESLSLIASEFSNFAKMPKSENEMIEITELINHNIELYNNFDNITIKLLIEKDQKYYVFADKKQLSRVFGNLIKNAIQAIDDKQYGIINVMISELEEYYKISISDNGAGISKEQISKIFSPNFTTKTGGMGMGLAIVKNIIESAGGSISFSSAEGVGTTFDVILPSFKT